MAKQSPLLYIFHVFGGPSSLAKALGISHSAVVQWRSSGRIPSKRCPQILEIARARGLDINSKDLIEGRDL